MGDRDRQRLSRKRVVDGRLRGLEAFDDATSNIGREAVLREAVETARELPKEWRVAWSDLAWALDNVVRNNSDRPRLRLEFNLDEALTAQEMRNVGAALGASMAAYKAAHPRR